MDGGQVCTPLLAKQFFRGLRLPWLSHVPRRHRSVDWREEDALEWCLEHASAVEKGAQRDHRAPRPNIAVAQEL